MPESRTAPKTRKTAAPKTAAPKSTETAAPKSRTGAAKNAEAAATRRSNARSKTAAKTAAKKAPAAKTTSAPRSTGPTPARIALAGKVAKLRANGVKWSEIAADLDVAESTLASIRKDVRLGKFASISPVAARLATNAI